MNITIDTLSINTLFEGVLNGLLNDLVTPEEAVAEWQRHHDLSYITNGDALGVAVAVATGVLSHATWGVNSSLRGSELPVLVSLAEKVLAQVGVGQVPAAQRLIWRWEEAERKADEALGLA